MRYISDTVLRRILPSVPISSLPARPYSFCHCVRRAQSLFDRNDLFILIYWFYSHSLFLMDSIRIHQRISSIVYRLSRLPHRIRNSMCWQIFSVPQAFGFGCFDCGSSCPIYAALSKVESRLSGWYARRECRPAHTHTRIRLRLDTVNVISSRRTPNAYHQTNGERKTNRTHAYNCRVGF